MERDSAPGEAVVNTHKVYCSACDREVTVMLGDAPSVSGGQAPIGDVDVVCLEIGERCTGALCPVCAVSAEAMDVRLAKSGALPDQHGTVRAVCEGCQRENDLMLTRGGYVTCPECGATRLRSTAAPTP